MKLIAGSYERFLWGWKVQEKEKKLLLQFSYPAHLGPVKCIAACGTMVATGGADDTIKVFDVGAQKDMGSLYQHQGAVTCLDYLKPSVSSLNRPTHLFSGSEDGTICIWDTDSWVHLKTMRSHKTAVNSLSVHNSGKVALSVERDGHLKMWNLLKGRCTFTTKLSSEATLVKFSPQSGDTYSVVKEERLEIYNVETGKLLHICDNEKRVLCMAQSQDDLIFTGGEDSIVRCWDGRSGKLALAVPKAHTNRIRGVALLNSGNAAVESGETPQFISSASSDGSVRIWDTRMVQSRQDGTAPEPAFETSTNARITCLVACGSIKRAGNTTSVRVGDGEAGTKDVSQENGVTRQNPQKPDTKGLSKKRDRSEKTRSAPTVRVENVTTDGRKRKKKRKKSSSSTLVSAEDVEVAAGNDSQENGHVQAASKKQEGNGNGSSPTNPNRSEEDVKLVPSVKVETSPNEEGKKKRKRKKAGSTTLVSAEVGEVVPKEGSQEEADAKPASKKRTGSGAAPANPNIGEKGVKAEPNIRVENVKKEGRKKRKGKNPQNNVSSDHVPKSVNLENIDLDREMFEGQSMSVHKRRFLEGLEITALEHGMTVKESDLDSIASRYLDTLRALKARSGEP
ncbi:hypothetical protein R1sor_020075 [Riccia sorocarpa]|uniref:Uncharacterized protein n=1 Tax=Riccia sorocarpa TaxID=122646 RepID=A0ABD3IEA8_9MARC